MAILSVLFYVLDRSAKLALSHAAERPAETEFLSPVSGGPPNAVSLDYLCPEWCLALGSFEFITSEQCICDPGTIEVVQTMSHSIMYNAELAYIGARASNQHASSACQTIAAAAAPAAAAACVERVCALVPHSLCLSTPHRRGHCVHWLPAHGHALSPSGGSDKVGHDPSPADAAGAGVAGGRCQGVRGRRGRRTEHKRTARKGRHPRRCGRSAHSGVRTSAGALLQPPSPHAPVLRSGDHPPAEPQPLGRARRGAAALEWPRLSAKAEH